jgi:hypothetical protein
MFRRPLGAAKGRRGRLCATCKHPGHLGKLRWLDLFLAPLPMNTENRILTVEPELVATVRKQVRDWSLELEDPPWIPSPAAKTLARGLRESCPTMAKALEQAEILEPWAEMLWERMWILKRSLQEDVGMTPSEAESQARMELIPSSPEMEAEWLEANCVDYDPEEFEEPQYSRPLLRLGEDDSWIPQMLEHCIRTALQRRDLPSETIMRLGAMLWVVEQLPQHCEECTAILTVSQDRGSGVASWDVRFDEEGLTLETNEIMRGEWGTDYNSREILKVTQTRWSTGMDDDPREWLDRICKKAGKADYEVSVEWYPEYQMPGEGE